MKIRIDIDPQLNETEVVIRCNQLDESIMALQSELLSKDSSDKKMIFYKGEAEYYISVEEILFFETSDNEVWAHLKDDDFIVKYKLYELDEILPKYFLRISKSAILNTKKVYSIVRNLTAASKVEFYGTHKVVYVSRNFYKDLKEKISLNIGE